MKNKFYRNKLFSVGIIIFLMLFISACSPSNSTLPATDSDTFSISGQVTVGGTGIAGVTVNLVNDGETPTATAVAGTKKISRNTAALAPTTTDASGNYTFSGLGNGTYTVIPQSGEYTFDDVSTVTNINGAPVTNVNFIGQTCVETFSISGRVTFLGIVAPDEVLNASNPSVDPSQTVAGLPGILIQLSLASAEKDLSGRLSSSTPSNIIGTAITDGTGYYSFYGVAPGEYVVTPVNANYVFNTSPYDVTITTDSVYDINWASRAVQFTQADLVGTWNMNLLRSGLVNEWTRAQIAVDAFGVASCVSLSDSTPTTGCPSDFDLTLTIDAAGVVTQEGENAADGGTGHMTMTSNKNFMAGTGTTGLSGSASSSTNKNPITGTSQNEAAGSYHLAIMQKVVPETAYGNIDLRNKSFVFHGMSVGGASGWAHGTGTTDAARLITMDTPVVSDGSVMTLPSGLTISVSNSGIVTVSGETSFQGFLSDDRKTIVGTFTTENSFDSNKNNTNKNTAGLLSGNSYQIVIIQILGQVYPEGDMPGQMSAGHSLATGFFGPFWIHYKLGTALGKMYTYNWETSNGIPAPSSGFYYASVSSTGTVTIPNDVDTGTGIPSFHGQISHDGLFMVGTQSASAPEAAQQGQGDIPVSDMYILTVTTKPGLKRLGGIY